MQTQTLQDGAESFKVSVSEAERVSPVVLFAVGAGGQPERHATLLNTLAEAGCTVVAPHFERLASPVPSEADLILRARRLSLALDAFVQSGTTAAGVGHSIGAARRGVVKAINEINGGGEILFTASALAVHGSHHDHGIQIPEIYGITGEGIGSFRILFYAVAMPDHNGVERKCLRVLFVNQRF